MYGDGSVDKHSNTWRILLKDEDIKVLERFSIYIYGFVHLYKEKVNYFQDETYYPYLYVTSTKMKQDLINLGCVPNKTFTIRLPDFSKVPDHLMNHFLRGFLDADGCICLEGSPRIDFTSNKDFIDDLIKFITQKFNMELGKPGINKENNNTHNIQIKGFSKPKIILDYLYKDATIFMERKYEKYQEYLKILDNREIKNNDKISSIDNYGTTYCTNYNNNILNPEYLKTLSKEEKNNIAPHLLNFYREHGFPYPLLSQDALFKDFSLLRNKDMSTLAKDNVLPLSETVGISFFKYFAPQFWEVNCGFRNKKNMLNTFLDDKLLLKVINNRLEGNYNMTGNMLRQGLPNSKVAYKASIFNPGIAKFLYQTYCKEGDVIYDYSMGFGQRLVAAMSLKEKIKYIWG